MQSTLADKLQWNFLQVIGEQVEQDKLNDTLASPVFSILIDETYCYNQWKGKICKANAHVSTVFLKITELPNGCAETIESALLFYLEEHYSFVSPSWIRVWWSRCDDREAFWSCNQIKKQKTDPY